VAERGDAEARRRETAQAAIAWARDGFKGLDLAGLESGAAWSRE